LYRYALKSLKREDMLKAINKKYKGIDLTLETVLGQVKFVRRLKIPFAILVILLLVVEMVSHCYGELNMPVLLQIRLVYISIFWLFLLVGFIIYGRKLVGIMPPDLIPKVRKVRKLK